MKSIFWTTFLALTLLLAACSAPATAVPLTPVQAATSAAPQSGFNPSEGVIATGKAEPAFQTNVSAAISAPIKEVLVKEGDVVKAGQVLATLDSPELQLSVTAAEFAVKSAELNYNYWVPARFNRPPERRQQAEAELDLTKAQLETAKASFAQTNLVAPFAATVVEVKLQADEIARAGQVVFVLGDIQNMQIRTTDLGERDIPSVQVGQTVKVFVQSLNATVTGRVTRISPYPETVGGDIVYPVTIELDQQLEGLLWGMTTEVQIATQ